MHKERYMTPDIVVVGSGIAGLSTAKMLTDQNYSVVVIEKAPVIAAGATTRNEGWLHAGTYHATAIANPFTARQVVSRSRFGHNYIRSTVPECIEDPSAPTYAFIKDETFVDFAEGRWQELGIEVKPIAKREMETKAPEISKDFVTSYEVEDTSINTRILTERLAEDIRSNGGTILTNTRFAPDDDEHATVVHPEFGKLTIRAGLFIITAGAAVKDLGEALTKEAFPMRFMKSHLWIVPRVTPYNAFYVDAGEAGMMNHGITSVMGMNRDGIPLDAPNYDVVPAKQEQIIAAAQRLLPRTGEFSLKGSHIACVKPDWYYDVADPMNVNVTLKEPISGYVLAVPGKMTEGPYLAKELLGHVEHRDSIKKEKNTVELPVPADKPISSLRPCDLYVAS